MLNPYKLVFVDESALHLDLSREYARAHKGERIYSSHPYRAERVSFIAALSLEGPQAPWLVSGGSVDSITFETYIEHVLIPTLKPGQVVILDNYSIHTGERVRELIEQAGCTLLFLPTYSPDLNPIENAFSKLKSYLKKLNAQTQLALSAALRQALNTITLSDIIAWFRLCGYLAQ